MPRSMKNPKAKRVGSCPSRVQWKRLRRMMNCISRKSRLMPTVVIPSVQGMMKVITYGRLEMGEVPSPGRVLSATPMPAKTSPMKNRIKRFLLL